MVLQEPHANNGLGARDRAVALLGDASLHADHASDEYNFFASDEVDGRAANFLKNVEMHINENGFKYPLSLEKPMRILQDKPA